MRMKRAAGELSAALAFNTTNDVLPGMSSFMRRAQTGTSSMNVVIACHRNCHRTAQHEALSGGISGARQCMIATELMPIHIALLEMVIDPACSVVFE